MLFLATIFALAAAAEPVPLERLVGDAVTSHPEVRLYRATLDEAKARRETAGKAAAPEISGSVGSQQVRDGSNRFVGEGTLWSVGVSRTFEWPGRLGLRRSIADGDVALAELGLARFRNALAGKVRAAALGLADAEEKARATAAVTERLRELREVLLRRDPAGISPKLELRILDATELTLRRQATGASLEADTARRELRLLLGIEAGAPVPAVAAPGMDLPGAPSTEDLVVSAMTNNFDLRLRLAEVGQQGLKVALTRNERGPAFTVNPQFREEPAGGRNQFFEVGVSFPLPLWKQQKTKIAAEEARLEQARTLVELARRGVERDVLAAHAAYEAKRTELARWNPESVAEFAAAAASADEHYRLGAVTVTTYVEMQRQYVDAVAALLDTRREAFAAAADLETLTGLRVLPSPSTENTPATGSHK